MTQKTIKKTSKHTRQPKSDRINPRRKMTQKTIKKTSKHTRQPKSDRNKLAAELEAGRVENDLLKQDLIELRNLLVGTSAALTGTKQGWNQSNTSYEELIEALKQDKEVLQRENERLAALVRSPSSASDRSLSMNPHPTTLKQFQTRVTQLEKLIDLLAADQSDLVRALITVFL
jgi:hypothetical protein